MNKDRRGKIFDITKKLIELNNELYDIKFDEELSYDSIPENLMSSDRAIESEESIDILDNTIKKLESIIEELKGI